MIVSQIMSRQVETCRPQDSLEQAVAKMWDGDIGGLPVVDAEGHVVGMLTDRDACMAAYTQGLPLQNIAVETAMSRQVFSCLVSDKIEDVEEIVRMHRVRRVPVIDDRGHPVGIVSMADIARESAREPKGRRMDVPADKVVAALAAVCAPRRGILTVAAQ